MFRLSLRKLETFPTENKFCIINTSARPHTEWHATTQGHIANRHNRQRDLISKQKYKDIRLDPFFVNQHPIKDVGFFVTGILKPFTYPSE